ncbi:ZN235 protein, partial [Acromyrmex heyeri]
RLDVLVCGQCHSIFHFIEEFQEYQENPRLKPSIKLKTKSGKATTEEDADLSNKEYIVDKILAKQNANLSNEEYNVDKILAKRFNTKKRCWEYLIEWKGNPQKKPRLKPSIKPKTKSGKATTEENANLNNEEYNVDKILAKRFNTKKRCSEYLIKWEGYPHENNTWESAEALATYKSLLDEFERSHAKQKESKEVQQKDNTKVVGRVSLPLQKSVIKTKTSQPGSSTAQTGRLIRFNKLKAIDKIKQWCNLIKDEENELLGKRRIDDSENDLEKGGSSAAKETIDDAGSDDEWTGEFEDERLLGRSVIQRTFNRANLQSSGFNKTSISSTDLATSLGLQSADEAKSSQPPVLVINEGVVKIDPKQMPNLTSDLYVMSRKDSISKLNSSPIEKLAVKGSSTTQGVVMVQNRDNTNVITYKCGKCSKTFICELHLRQHEKIHMKKSQCEFCKKILSNKSLLHRHKKEIHFNVLNDCNDCKKGFNNEQDFNNHLITKHSDIDAKPYKCEICPAAFKRSNDLKRHTQTHAEKPHVCEICSKVFNFKINLIKHKRIHSDKKPYKCLICNKDFMRKASLLTHIQNEKNQFFEQEEELLYSLDIAD